MFLHVFVLSGSIESLFIFYRAGRKIYKTAVYRGLAPLFLVKLLLITQGINTALILIKDHIWKTTFNGSSII